MADIKRQYIFFSDRGFTWKDVPIYYWHAYNHINFLTLLNRLSKFGTDRILHTICKCEQQRDIAMQFFGIIPTSSNGEMVYISQHHINQYVWEIYRGDSTGPLPYYQRRPGSRYGNVPVHRLQFVRNKDQSSYTFSCVC